MDKPTHGVRAAAPLHPGFINAGATLLIAACVTDFTYCKTSIWQWANFSAWLIAAGLVVALVATLALIFDFLVGRARRLDVVNFALVAVAAVLSIVNVFVHSRDSWTSVAPQGVVLSTIVTLLLLVAAARGWRVTAPSPSVSGERA